jgi:two-component system phosphate regulon response regulator PhoB
MYFINHLIMGESGMSGQGPGPGYRIWILEDDPDIGFILEIFLKDEGFQVDVSATTRDFWSAVESGSSDIFLLDVMLPDGDGIDVCRELKNGTRYSHIPVLMMSAHADMEQFGDCGPDAFIAKPFDLEKMLTVINRKLAAIPPR